MSAPSCICMTMTRPPTERAVALPRASRGPTTMLFVPAVAVVPGPPGKYELMMVVPAP